MATLVDASALIAAERGRLDTDRILESHGETGLALAAITASDLLHGVHCLRASARKARAEAFVEALLQVSVATRDRRGFSKIPGLDVVYW